jgi:CheY-like chemotaxis protein
MADRARLQVWDMGTGIPPERQSEIFEEFVQLDNAERRREKGLGLGLSIVERSARLLNHRLSLRSAPGRGSCFSIDVPLARAVQLPPEPADKQIGLDDIDLAECKVLVVEDDALARRALVDLLRSWGCTVIEAADAQEAQQALSSGCRPDIVASDIRLPDGQSGIDLLRRTRATLGRDIAAFLISGDTDSHVIMAASAARFPLLHKPVKAARLRTMLQLLLKGTRDAGA